VVNINLFGGPGTGKSTTATKLFSMMKEEDFKVEYIPEFAKELIYAENYKTLSDQLFVTATQHNRSAMIRDSVEFLVHDSPVLLGAAYANYLGKMATVYEELLVLLHNNTESLNIFLTRDNINHPYQQYGREQELVAAIDKDIRIKKILHIHEIPYMEIPVVNAADAIFKIIKTKGQKCSKLN